MQAPNCGAHTEFERFHYAAKANEDFRTAVKGRHESAVKEIGVSDAADGGIAGSLRLADPDRYFISLFAPGRSREALALLLAFDRRLWSVEARGEDIHPALIRLAWWRDQLAALAGSEIRGEPLLSAIRDAIPAADHGVWSELAEAHMDRVEGSGEAAIWRALTAAAARLVGERAAGRIAGALRIARRQRERSPTRRQWAITWHMLTGRGG